MTQKYRRKNVGDLSLFTLKAKRPLGCLCLLNMKLFSFEKKILPSSSRILEAS